MRDDDFFRLLTVAEAGRALLVLIAAVAIFWPYFR